MRPASKEVKSILILKCRVHAERYVDGVKCLIRPRCDKADRVRLVETGESRRGKRVARFTARHVTNINVWNVDIRFYEKTRICHNRVDNPNVIHLPNSCPDGEDPT